MHSLIERRDKMADDNEKGRLLLRSDTLHIGFHGVGKAPYPEDIVAPGVLRAIAQHLKLDLQTEGIFWGDYCFFAGVTGEAFRFLEFMELAEDDTHRPLVARYGHATAGEMYSHAFDAAGLDADICLKPHLPEKAALQRLVTESLHDRQTPLMGIGAFGPPEPFLITGHAEEAEAILGWSHFQGEKKDDLDLSFEPSGQFRLCNWYDAIDGIAVITGTKDRPPAHEIYLDALKRALIEIQTTGELGTSAMERWAVHLEDDAQYEGFTDSQWRKAHTDHGTTAGDLAERRALASTFLELAQRFVPEAAGELEIAGAAFQGMHDTVYEIWETAAKTSPFDPDLEKFKDPAVRRTMASLVRRLAQLDHRGAGFLEQALAAAEGRSPSPKIPEDPVLDGTTVLTKANPVKAGEFLWAPENIALPNQMSMLQAFLGESIGTLSETERSNRKIEYCLWMGFSGAAFGLLRDGPERSNLPLVFDALGYDYELWMSKELADETGLACRIWGWDDNLRRRIFWNLRDRKLPVLLFNWDEWPDWRLITAAEHWWSFRGYGGENGEGYRPNEPLDHPKNPLRPVELFEGMKGEQTWTINILAKRSTPRPSMKELYRRAVAWGVQKMEQQRMCVYNAKSEEVVSTRPYRSWAEMLRTDALFPSDDIAKLKERRNWLKGHEVELAERRFYGAGFLECAAERLGKPELTEAAENFRRIHALAERIWEHLGGLSSPEAHRALADRSTRERIADLILEIEREDETAAALLAR
jgi:hypothetical protein